MMAAALIVYVRTEFGIERPNDAKSILYIAFIGLVVGMILSIAGLPRLESFVGLFIFTAAAIFFVNSMHFYNFLP